MSTKFPLVCLSLFSAALFACAGAKFDETDGTPEGAAGSEASAGSSTSGKGGSSPSGGASATAGTSGGGAAGSPDAFGGASGSVGGAAGRGGSAGVSQGGAAGMSDAGMGGAGTGGAAKGGEGGQSQGGEAGSAQGGSSQGGSAQAGASQGGSSQGGAGGSSLGGAAGEQGSGGSPCVIASSINVAKGNAESVTGDTNNAPGNDSGAYCEKAGANGKDLTYEVTAQQAGKLFVDARANDASIDIVLSTETLACTVFTLQDGDCSNLGGGGGDELIELDVTAGQTFWVHVDNPKESQGKFELWVYYEGDEPTGGAGGAAGQSGAGGNASSGAGGAAGAGGDGGAAGSGGGTVVDPPGVGKGCASPKTLSIAPGDSLVIEGTTVGATDEYYGHCASSAVGGDLTYQVTPTGSGTLEATLESLADTYDPVLIVELNECSGITLGFDSDDFCGDITGVLGNEQKTVPVAGNTPLWVAVDSNRKGALVEGPYRLTLKLLP